MGSPMTLSHLILSALLTKSSRANDRERYKAKGTLYMLNYDPQVPNFSPFCSTIARFPDN